MDDDTDPFFDRLLAAFAADLLDGRRPEMYSSSMEETTEPAAPAPETPTDAAEPSLTDLAAEVRELVSVGRVRREDGDLSMQALTVAAIDRVGTQLERIGDSLRDLAQSVEQANRHGWGDR